MKCNIVTIGGGSGLSTLLRGLKKYPVNITAVVAVSDDGGSSGKLRTEFGVLPPGDIRNCLVALSEEENLMTKLFGYRFPKKGSLSNHSFGNLFLTALSSISGGFDKAITNASSILAIKGKVLPVSLDNVILKAELEDGTRVSGETKISRSKKNISHVEIFPKNAKSSKSVTDAILNADYVILGPGSLYTSIIVNLLFKGVINALRKTKAKKIYVCNIMTQVGETTNFKLSDHINAIEKHSYKGIIDIVLVNNGKIHPSVAQRYKKEKSMPVIVDKKALKNVKIIERDFISKTQYAHHDYTKLAKVIFNLPGRKLK
ncbi:gluconeogenesis factor YvcK family protein [Candidatus Ruminimicrobium bovinum]|uniref:gluconeogenesis factor YvcK family protein n=1 Tax=Candidatus Ruminimicrobium bovinum TaxID=3242779 RepID=UPI0039B977E2